MKSFQSKAKVKSFRSSVHRVTTVNEGLNKLAGEEYNVDNSALPVKSVTTISPVFSLPDSLGDCRILAMPVATFDPIASPCVIATPFFDSLYSFNCNGFL